MGCSAAPLASTHYIPVALLSSSHNNQKTPSNVPGGQNCPQLRITVSDYKLEYRDVFKSPLKQLVLLLHVGQCEGVCLYTLFQFLISVHKLTPASYGAVI